MVLKWGESQRQNQPQNQAGDFCHAVSLIIYQNNGPLMTSDLALGGYICLQNAMAIVIVP